MIWIVCVFRGIRASHIFFDSSDGRWTLESLKNKKRKSKLSKDHSEKGFPLGRLTWTVEVIKIRKNHIIFGQINRRLVSLT